MFEWIGIITGLVCVVIVIFVFLVGAVALGVEIGLERYYKGKNG